MKGMTVMKQLNGIDDILIQNAYLPDTVPDGKWVKAPRRERVAAVMSSGWMVACICAVVSIGVYVSVLGWNLGWFSPAGAPPETEPGIIYESNTEEAITEAVTEAANYSTGLSYIKVDGGFSVNGMGSCTDRDVIIPSEYLGDPVIAVAEMAFYQNQNIRSVVLPDSVTDIGEHAFDSCQNLSSVRLPENHNTIIRAGAFKSCVSLTEIYLQDGTDLEWGAFEGATSLSSVRLPSDLTSIAGRLFQDCTSLASIELPDTLESIGREAFQKCTALKEIQFPESLRSISDYAFEQCGLDLEAVRIPDSVEYIGEVVFQAIGAIPGLTFYPDGTILEENGEPMKTYECYVDNCLIYLYTTNPSYTVREGTRLIASGALDLYSYIGIREMDIYLPDSLEYLCENWICSTYRIHGEYTHIPVTSAS